jgi:peptide/nickel transport system permease protein
MSVLVQSLRGVGRYPSAVIGLVIIAGLIVLSLFTLLTVPYDEAVRLWRGGDSVWIETPRNAAPAWVNLFPGVNRPETVIVASTDGVIEKERATVSEEVTDVTFTLPFVYTYDGFPQEVAIFLTSAYEAKRPHVSLSWVTPDDREIRLGDLTVQGEVTYLAAQDERLKRRLGGQSPEIGLFADPESSEQNPQPLDGPYELRVAGLVFEDDAELDAKLVVYGQVYGMAGTDHRRRDLMLALLWGTPVALAFGLLAAVGTTITTMIIAAVGVWFGGWVDAAIQRITELNLILPVLPILIMVGTFYSRSIWMMLGVVILLGLFGASIKTYRAIFLQVKESPYIEAARAYGAGNFRIILRYLVPRIIPILVPQFVVLIPSFVFLEATLSVLGLGDPVLPTWGKVLNDARANGALYQGHYYWMLEPAVLLILTGLGFAMVGFALDRVFNPKLREL